jgi:hypothetical protein
MAGWRAYPTRKIGDFFNWKSLIEKIDQKLLPSIIRTVSIISQV